MIQFNTCATGRQTVRIVHLCKREITQMEIKGLPESVELPKGSQGEKRRRRGGERQGEEHWKGKEKWGCLTFKLASSFIMA